MPESDLLLLSRNIFPGDIVKRTLSSSQAAIVLSTKTEVLLEKSFDAEKIEGWIPMEKLTSAARFRPGDKVIKDEWVGVVTMIAQVGYVINEKSGRVYYPCDTMGAFDVGTRVSVSRPTVTVQYADSPGHYGCIIQRKCRDAYRALGAARDRLCLCDCTTSTYGYLASHQSKGQ